TVSVTYTPAADRVLHQMRASRWRLEMADAALLAGSILALFAIALACAGALRAIDRSEHSARRASIVNLNTVADAEALEPPLSIVFPNPSERRSAARDLFRFVVAQRENGRRVPNVGALARARAGAAA